MMTKIGKAIEMEEKRVIRKYPNTVMVEKEVTAYIVEGVQYFDKEEALRAEKYLNNKKILDSFKSHVSCIGETWYKVENIKEYNTLLNVYNYVSDITPVVTSFHAIEVRENMFPAIVTFFDYRDNYGDKEINIILVSAKDLKELL